MLWANVLWVKAPRSAVSVPPVRRRQLCCGRQLALPAWPLPLPECLPPACSAAAGRASALLHSPARLPAAAGCNPGAAGSPVSALGGLLPQRPAVRQHAADGGCTQQPPRRRQPARRPQRARSAARRLAAGRRCCGGNPGGGSRGPGRRPSGRRQRRRGAARCQRRPVGQAD